MKNTGHASNKNGSMAFILKNRAGFYACNATITFYRNTKLRDTKQPDGYFPYSSFIIFNAFIAAGKPT